VAHFGHLDILIANTGILRPMDKSMLRMIIAILVADLCQLLKPLASKDLNGWWDVFEANIRGPYNFIQYASYILSDYITSLSSVV
jgi:NAD(P)-dependent dehydrogenase (short-subunit alcohol dehydrogenase family)